MLQVLALAVAALATSSAQAWPTQVTDIRTVASHTRVLSEMRQGGYETAQGSRVSNSSWYSTKWTNIQVSGLTPITPRAGIVWAVSTGEVGEKYRVAPQVRLGFVLAHELDRHSTLSVRATRALGGGFREHSCWADYGDIGGQQQVNCRLAATALAPAETLQYLINQPAENRNSVGIEFSLKF